MANDWEVNVCIKASSSENLAIAISEWIKAITKARSYREYWAANSSASSWPGESSYSYNTVCKSPIEDLIKDLRNEANELENQLRGEKNG
jgi:hypothetical protein